MKNWKLLGVGFQLKELIRFFSDLDRSICYISNVEFSQLQHLANTNNETSLFDQHYIVCDFSDELDFNIL